MNKSSKEEKLFNDYQKSIFKGDKILKFIDTITGKKFMHTVYLLIFISVCIIVVKSFYYKNGFFIGSKIDDEVVVNTEDNVDVNKLKRSAVDEYVKCLSSKTDNKELSDDVKKIITKINNYYKKSNGRFAFKYVDLHTGFSVAINENQKIYAASTIKAPANIYIWELVSNGQANLNDKLKYTVGYYNTGSGVLKNKKFNTEYTIRDLLRYSIVYSDNAAYAMLMNKFGRKNMLNYWKEKGTNAIFTSSNIWGSISAHDAAIYLKELYKFYVENDEYGSVIMNDFISAKTKFISSKSGYKIASKAGWWGNTTHDTTIVFADNPYILVGLSSLGYYGSRDYFKTISDLAEDLHTEYWKYKMDTCSKIKQY